MRATLSLILLFGCGGGESSDAVQADPAPKAAPVPSSKAAAECGKAMCRNYDGDPELYQECFDDACPPHGPSWNVQVRGIEAEFLTLNLEHTPAGYGPKSEAPQDTQWTVQVTVNGEDVPSSMVNAKDAPVELEFPVDGKVETLHVAISGDEATSHFPAEGIDLTLPETLEVHVRDGGGGDYRKADAFEKAVKGVFEPLGTTVTVSDGAPWIKHIERDTLYYANPAFAPLARDVVMPLRPRPEIVHVEEIGVPMVLVAGGTRSENWTPATWTVTPTQVSTEGKVTVDATVSYAPASWNGDADAEEKPVWIGLTVWDGEREAHDAEAVAHTFSGEAGSFDVSFSADVDGAKRLAIGVWSERIEPCAVEREGCTEFGYVLDGLVGSFPDMVPYYIPAYTDPGDLTLELGGTGLDDKVADAALTGMKAVVEPFGGTVTRGTASGEADAKYVRVFHGGEEKDKRMAVLLAEAIRPAWNDPGKVIVSAKDDLAAGTLQVIVGALAL